ncbi:Uncharacterized protein containing SIS (Sugar ISomerase) phosphosugar binding domain [Chlamydia abortus]|nr:Uncharacterized protein containing SIS (Sugar ISomerase) phosphosugar binding domain [Chlamydia abortus]
MAGQKAGKQYAEKVISHIHEIIEKESAAIDKAADKVAATIARDGLVHLFGCGHSHMLAEEVFYRAGGLAAIQPILDTAVMLHEGAVKSSMVERMEGYAAHILNNYDVKPGEPIIILSNSGVNGVPVDMAMEAKAKGLYVIAIVSSAYYEDAPRHSSGRKLYEVADLVIDNHLPHGDALMEVAGTAIRMSPGSTVIGATILNMMMTMAVCKLAEQGIEPPVFRSGNVPGGFEQNLKYIEKYRKRIKHL